MGWAEAEFKTLDLGDERLNKRAVLLAERLAEKPMASIPGACQGWAETQAAYRFMAHRTRWTGKLFWNRIGRARYSACVNIVRCYVCKTPRN